MVMYVRVENVRWGGHGDVPDDMNTSGLGHGDVRDDMSIHQGGVGHGVPISCV